MDIVYFYLPFVLSLLLLAIGCFKKFDVSQKSIPISILEFIKFDLPISSPIIAKVFMISLSILIMFLALNREYSSYFPKDFSMEVFYDKPGINEILNTFSKKELEDLRISGDVSIRDTVYFTKLDGEIKKNNIASVFFTRKDCKIHSSGNTNFKVEKIDGFQKYHVYESKGELQHFLECSQEKQGCVKSFFDKLPSNYDYITASFFSITIMPQFKQTIAENNRSDGIIFNHILYGLTKINIFPTMTYSNTLYLFEYNNYLYPIGYAVYKK